MSGDPRTSIRYARMVDVIDLIQRRGPQTIDQICKRLKVNEYTFKMDRGSHSGKLAMSDHGLTMPRPVASENYTYKLASTYRTGASDTDGEPNIQHMTGDLLTRTTTLYSDVDTLVGLVSGRAASDCFAAVAEGSGVDDRQRQRRCHHVGCPGVTKGAARPGRDLPAAASGANGPRGQTRRGALRPPFSCPTRHCYHNIRLSSTPNLRSDD